MEGVQGFFSSLSSWILGDARSKQPKPASPPTKQAREIRPIEVIPLHQLVECPLANFEATETSHLNEVTERLYNLFATRGFIVLSLDSTDESLSTLLKLRESSREFFAYDTLLKERMFAQFAGENRGYVLIPELREYLKLRVDDVVAEGTKIGKGENFKEAFVPSFHELSDIMWVVYHHLYHASRVRFFRGVDKGSEKLLLSQEELDQTKECILERSYVSIIHYFASEAGEEGNEAGKEEEGTEKEKEKEKDEEGKKKEPRKKRCVCSTHTDTGILTGILCAETPALEVLDKESDSWIKVEEVLHNRRKTETGEVAYLILMMGEKAPLFTGSRQLQPTKHRVNLFSGVARESLLFFMDTSKAS